MQFVVITNVDHAGPLTLPYRNGAPFLRVDGTCRYWVYGLGLADAASSTDPSLPRMVTGLDPIITGELTSEQAEDLATATHYLRWKDYDGNDASLTSIGMTPSVFTDGEHRFSCASACDGPGMPDGAHGLRTTALEWILHLTDLGNPVGGPLRVATFDASTARADFEAIGYQCLKWSLPLRPQEYAEADTLNGALGTLVTSEAASLRSVREQFRADRFRVPLPSGVPPWSVNVGLPFCDEDKLWSLLASDVVEPYEVDGLLPSQ